MATINVINSNMPIETSKGGSAADSFSNTYGVICADSAGTALTSIDPGTSGQVLQSAGSGSLPSFQTAGTTAPMFQVLSSDPSSPVAGQCWYNSTSDLYKAYDGVGTAIVIFTVT